MGLPSQVREGGQRGGGYMAATHVNTPVHIDCDVMSEVIVTPHVAAPRVPSVLVANTASVLRTGLIGA